MAKASGHRVKRGELVVFRPPFRSLPGEAQQAPNWLPWMNDSVYVKRIIGLPGDTVKVIAQQGVWRNGQRLLEPYVVTPPRYDWGPLRVPEGHAIVLGDNRNDSFDSHHWGFLPLEHIVGRPTVRVWPPSRWTRF
jgi:signal peptidase I